MLKTQYKNLQELIPEGGEEMGKWCSRVLWRLQSMLHVSPRSGGADVSSMVSTCCITKNQEQE